MDPYRQQYPPYSGQPPQQPPPHLRHGAPPPGSHYGPPPPHMQGRPPHMQPPPMYQGAPPPSHLQQQYPPPHMQGPPPPFQGRGPMPSQRPPLGVGGPPPNQHYPPQHPSLQHQGPPPPGPGGPYGAVPPNGPPPGLAPPHSQHHHRMPRPPYGSGSLPPAALGAPPGSAPMGMGGPPGFVNAPPPSSGPGFMTGPPNGMSGGNAIPASAFVVGGALPDKMNTLFIGSIAPGINNVAMEKLLKTTGNLVKWKRVQDPTSQQWKAFGFAEYADADSLLRTLRVLGQDGQQPKGEKPVGLELTAMDGSGVVKALLVKADEKTRQFLDQYEETRPRTIHDTEKDKVALGNAMKIIQKMKDGTLDTSEPEQGSEVKEDTTTEDAATSKPDSESTEAEVSEEQKELIARELNFFRERAALKEKEKREEEEKAERQRANQQHRQQQQQNRDKEAAPQSTTSSSHRMGRERAWGGNSGSSSGSTRLMDFVPASGSNHIEVGSGGSSSAPSTIAATAAEHDTSVDSDAEEKARQERKDRELEHSYKERERRWEQREAERARLYEKDKQRDEDYAAEQAAAKEAMAYRYAQWNDDVEREKRHDDYYRDRSRWWQRRQAFLQKEERYDALDREEEKEELEQAAKKAQEANAAAAAAANSEIPTVDHDGDSAMKDASSSATVEETSVSTPTSSTTPNPSETALASTILPNQPTKLKLSLATTAGGLKRGSEASSGSGTPTSGTSGSGFVVASEFGRDDDEEKEVKKRRVLVPLKYSDDEGEADEKNQQVNSGLDPVEKAKREQEIKALFQSIPADAQGLWNWPIQWQYVFEDNELILKEKIRPFASKKVVELLGEEDEELTGFVMEHVRQRKPPQELVDDLTKALDDDAGVLVMKVWRMLIFETESQARKLTSKR